MTRRFALSLMLAFLGTLYISPKAIAEEMLFVSPTRIEMDTNNPRAKIVVLNLHNKDKIRRVYKLEASDLVMDEQGTTKNVDSFPHSASRMIRFFPRRVDLAPDGRQKIRVMATVRDTPEDGDYHTHLFFNEITTEVLQEEAKKKGKKLKTDDGEKYEEGTAKMAAALEFSVGIPVRVRVGSVQAKVALNGATYEQINPERGQVTLDLSRQGNGEGVGYLDVFINNDGNREKLVDKAIIRIYRERDQINKPYPVNLNKYPSTGTIEAYLYTSADAGPNDTTRILGTASASMP